MLKSLTFLNISCIIKQMSKKRIKNHFDGRCKKSRNTIETTLFRLLKQKPLAKIKVNEICALSGVSCATFRRHYRNVNEVLERKDLNIFKECTEIIDNFEKSKIPTISTQKVLNQIFDNPTLKHKQKLLNFYYSDQFLTPQKLINYFKNINQNTNFKNQLTETDLQILIMKLLMRFFQDLQYLQSELSCCSLKLLIKITDYLTLVFLYFWAQNPVPEQEETQPQGANYTPINPHSKTKQDLSQKSYLEDGFLDKMIMMKFKIIGDLTNWINNENSKSIGLAEQASRVCKIVQETK